MNAKTRSSKGNQEPNLSFNKINCLSSLKISRSIEDGEEEWEG